MYNAIIENCIKTKTAPTEKGMGLFYCEKKQISEKSGFLARHFVGRGSRFVFADCDKTSD